MKTTRLLLWPYRWLLLVITICLTTFLGWRWLDDQQSEKLLTETIQRGNIENFISATGKLEPKHYVEVGAQVSGQVKALHVEEGAIVKAGDLVAEIDATVFETRVQNAQASLEGKKAQLIQLQAELELANLRAKRNLSLHQKNAVSDDELFASTTNEKILRAQITAMKAQIKADAASLAGDKATLGYANIYAPIDGTVVNVQVRQGQTLNANQNAPTLLKIADLTVLTLRAEVSEADIPHLYAGMPVYFKTFGGGERRWQSTIRQVLPTPSVINDVVLYQALIDIDNNDGRLMDAMTTQAFFLLDQAKDVILVPLGAIQTNTPAKKNQRSYVQQHTANGLIDTPVRLGLRNRTHAQVIKGLKAGDSVVVGSQARDSKNGRTDNMKRPPRGF